MNKLPVVAFFLLGICSVLAADCAKPNNCQTTSSTWHSPPIPAAERQALIDFFHATNGEHWKNKTGWLGAPGTECEWFGITCIPEHRSSRFPNHVNTLELSKNNLVGTLPKSLDSLSKMEQLILYNNKIAGGLPKLQLKRWLDGSLAVSADASLYTDTQEIDLASRSTSIRCRNHRLILRSDGQAITYSELCRNTTQGDRDTFCEVKRGHVDGDTFAKLVWLARENDFFDLGPPSSHDFSVSDGEIQSLRMTTPAKTYEIQDSGSHKLWVIQSSIRGVATQIKWATTNEQPRCPNW